MDPITLATYPSLQEAQLAKNLLEEEGIPAFLADDASADMLHLTAPGNEVKLLVAGEHAARAQEVLRAATESHAAHLAEIEAEIGPEEA